MTEQPHDAGSTRRQFLKASATGAAATAMPGVAHAIEKAVSGGPAVEKQITPLRATDQISRWAENLKPALAVPTEPNAVRAWRPRARETIGRLLALDEATTAQPHVESLGRSRHENIVVHRIAIGPADEQPWEAVVMQPAKSQKPRGAWLCLHGHMAGGCSSVTGLVVDAPGGRESLEKYEGDYALQLARRGYVTMAFDFPGFGRRGTEAVPSKQMLSRALMVGRPYLGWCVANAMAALTVLRTWPTVRPDRVGVMGFSMGGTLAGMTAAADERVCAAALSGRFPSWRDRLARGSAMELACIPGMVRQLDLGDMLAAAVPVPLFVSMEVLGDPEKSRQLLAPIRRAYQGFNAMDRLTEYYDNAPRHRFVGEPMYRWIEQSALREG